MLTIPEGTIVSVELIDPVSSSDKKAGDTFRARLNEGVWIQGRTALPPGVTVRGQVAFATASGRIKGKSQLGLTLDSVEVEGKSYALHTDTLTYTGETHTGKHIGSTFFGALQGALYGVLFGGKEGAVLGAGAGAGAGAAGSIFKGKSDIKFDQGAKLMFEFKEPVTVVAPPGPAAPIGAAPAPLGDLPASAQAPTPPAKTEPPAKPEPVFPEPAEPAPGKPGKETPKPAS